MTSPIRLRGDTPYPERRPPTITSSDTTDLFRDLAGPIRGRVLTPSDPDYASLLSPYNLAVVPHPAAVIEVADATDIAVVMRFAAGHDHDVAVQLIGHGALEHTRPTLLVQTRLLDEVEIRDHTARVGAGVRWEAVIAAAAPLGLMPLAGSAPRVGVVGYLTGGGLSPIGRGYGFASDLVTAIDVVTGDGTILRATPSENTDLFWGLRGGKGALGIVSAVEFTLVDLPEFFGGCLYFSAADVADVTHR